MAINYNDAINYNGRQLEDGDFTRDMIVRLVEEWQRTHGLKVDGKCGPGETQPSIQAAIPVVAPVPNIPWTPWDGPLPTQPKNRTEVYEMFGRPGDPSTPWAKKHIIEVHGANALPGVPGKWYVKIEKDIEPYAREGLRRAKVSSPYVIERCGGYVYRHSQFNPDMALSYHASGLALDFDADDNQSRRFDPSDVPKPWDQQWMKIWPRGVDEQWVLAMASCGWSWGGYWNRVGTDGMVYIDPMHVQWVGGRPV